VAMIIEAERFVPEAISRRRDHGRAGRLLGAMIVGDCVLM
jgi:hypothetical protein